MLVHLAVVLMLTCATRFGEDYSMPPGPRRLANITHPSPNPAETWRLTSTPPNVHDIELGIANP